MLIDIAVAAAVSPILVLIGTILPLFALYYIGVRRYDITDRTLVATANSKLLKMGFISTNMSEGRINGYFYGKWAVGKVSQSNKSPMSIICTETFYKDLIDTVIGEETEKNDDEPPKKKKVVIKAFYKLGTYFESYYRSYKFIMDDIEPRAGQVRTVDEISRVFRERRRCVAYVHGETGSGKSKVAQFLAAKLNGSICRKFNPTDPGDGIRSLFAYAMPEESSPLIIVLEEFDIILNDVIHGRIKRHKSVPIEVYDKSTLNNFFDDIDNGELPNVIIVLTSNVPPTYYDNIDPSLLRAGRVDLRLTI